MYMRVALVSTGTVSAQQFDLLIHVVYIIGTKMGKLHIFLALFRFIYRGLYLKFAFPVALDKYTS